MLWGRAIRSVAGSRGKSDVELPLSLIIRRWWLVGVAGVIIAAVAGFAIARAQTPIYESEVQLLVGRASDDLSDIRAAQALAETYAERAVRTPTLRTAAQDAGISIAPDALRESVRARANELTRILSVRVRYRSPTGAAELANALGRELVAIATRSVGESSAGTLEIIERAVPRPTAVSPNTELAVALAGLAGLAVAALIALGVELLGDQIRDRGDAESLAGVSCITIPSVRPKRFRRASTPKGAYRLVAAALEPRDGQPAPRSVSVATVGHDPSASEVALRLSEALASAGHDVLLVDADPARDLTARLRIEGPGLAELLDTSGFGNSAEVLRPLIRPTTLPELSIVAAGHADAAAIDAERAEKILQRLLNETQRVVLATGSVLDGQGVGWVRSTDAVLLVADERTRRSRLADAARSLRTSGASLVAALLQQA